MFQYSLVLKELILVFAFFTLASPVHAQTVEFPGEVGFGKFAKGLMMSVLLAGVVFFALVLSPGYSFAQQAGNPTIPDTTLRTHATIHSIGLEWDLTGDNNHNAQCSVRYRKAGELAWKDAMSLIRVDYFGRYLCDDFDDGSTCHPRSTADRPYNMLAGSIFFLDPSTTYEIELKLTDADGGSTQKNLNITTRGYPQLPTTGNTYHVVPGSGGGDGSANNPFKGPAAAEAVAQPGDIFLLHRGYYSTYTFQKAGQSSKHIVWKSAGDGDVVFYRATAAGDYQWFEGITFQYEQGKPWNAWNPAFRAVDQIEGVLLRNKFLGHALSIYLGPGNEKEQRDFEWHPDPGRTRDWYIAHNTIIGSKDKIQNNYQNHNDPLHVADEVIFAGKGIVFANNYVAETTDAVSASGSNHDIYHNDIRDVYDDGFEMDSCYANIRIWENRLINIKNSALSFQPQFAPPWYFIRNQVVGMRNHSFFKFRVESSNVIVNNTLVGWGQMMRRAHHIFSGKTYNNLWIQSGGTDRFWAPNSCNNPGTKGWTCITPDVYFPNWRTDMDYNGYDFGQSYPLFDRGGWGGPYNSLSAFSEALGVEANGVEVNKNLIFDQFNVPSSETENISLQVLRLHSGSNAVDAGKVIPNITDNFSGSSPDLGALELGHPAPAYGPQNSTSPPDTTPPSAPRNLRIL